MPAVDVPPELVAAAVGGDRRALEDLLSLIADDIRRMARRMLWHPEDADDASQEILVGIATRLSSFRGEARVTTWAHRIAVNHLLTTRRRRAEDPSLNFAAFGRDLADDLDAPYDAGGVDGLKRDMEAFTDAGAIFRSHPELRANSGIVDAVMRAVA